MSLYVFLFLFSVVAAPPPGPLCRRADRLCCARGLVTLTSISRCLSLVQLYTMMSPGFRPSDNPPLCSMPILYPAFSTALERRSLIELCRQMRDGPDPHITAWLPLVSHRCQWQ